MAKTLVQRNFTASTKSTISGTVFNESTVRSDGTNIPASFVLSKAWVEPPISLGAVRLGSPVVSGTDYTVSVMGNKTIVTPITVWTSQTEVQN